MKFQAEWDAPWAYCSKLLVLNTGEWRYQKPVTNASKCCQCGICYFFCPTGCVKDTGGYYTADLHYCKGCGICVRLCPADAIEMVREA